MKNSILYIVGAVVLLGGGAFLFLRNKKSKDISKLKDIALETANIGVPTTGDAKTDVKAKDENKTAQDVKNLAEATSVAKQIYIAKQQIDEANKYNNVPGRSYSTQSNFEKIRNEQLIFNNSTQVIPTLIKQLEDLGYTESYGIAIKK